VNFLETDRARVIKLEKEVRKEVENLKKRLEDRCGGCGGSVRLVYCKGCIKEREVKIGQLEEAYKAARSHISRDYLAEIEKRESDDSE